MNFIKILILSLLFGSLVFVYGKYLSNTSPIISNLFLVLPSVVLVYIAICIFKEDLISNKILQIGVVLFMSSLALTFLKKDLEKYQKGTTKTFQKDNSQKERH